MRARKGLGTAGREGPVAGVRTAGGVLPRASGEASGRRGKGLLPPPDEDEAREVDTRDRQPQGSRRAGLALQRKVFRMMTIFPLWRSSDPISTNQEPCRQKIIYVMPFCFILENINFPFFYL